MASRSRDDRRPVRGTGRPPADRGSRLRALARGVVWRVEALRVAFGLVWAIDAYYKWQPAFIDDYAKSIVTGAKDQPDALRPWFRFWRDLVGRDPHLFAYATAALETALAVALLVGFARRLTYVGGALWSLAIWTIPEGFGGSFTTGATDIGSAIIYVLVFGVLYALEALPAATARWTIDARIERRVAWWRWIAEPGGGRRYAP